MVNYSIGFEKLVGDRAQGPTEKQFRNRTQPQVVDPYGRNKNNIKTFLYNNCDGQKERVV